MGKENQLKKIVIFAMIIILVESGFISGTHASNNQSNIAQNIHSNGINITNNQLKIISHLATQNDIDTIIARYGVRDKNKNYNVIINGRGTGFAPPAEEDYEQMVGSIQIVDNAPPQAPLSSSLDLSADPCFPPVGDQGLQGSCSAWAATYYATGYVQAKLHNWNEAHSGNPDQLLSPAWTYNKCNGGSNDGSSIFDNMLISESIGVCRWSKLPYDWWGFDVTNWGGENAWRDAPSYRVNTIYNLWDYNITDIKNILNQGYPITFALDANSYNNFGWDDVLGSNAMLDDINHANTIVGYDDSKVDHETGEVGAFKIVNSWGWLGPFNGYYWITYQAFLGSWNFYSLNFVDALYVDTSPKLLGVWNLNPQCDRFANFRLGIGNYTDPIDIRQPFWIRDYDHYFPSFMCLDITEFIDTWMNQSVDFYLQIWNTIHDGRITSFRLEYYQNGYSPGDPTKISDESPDTPKNTPCNVSLTFLWPLYVYIDKNYNISTPGWHIDHYDKIQDGINVVADNGTVYVNNGNYNESLIINKSIRLIGENKNYTIVEGRGGSKITVDWVIINEFTFQNSELFGVFLDSSNQSIICHNIIKNNDFNIVLHDSSNNFFYENNITNDLDGFTVGFALETSSNNNLIFHNNLKNRYNAVDQCNNIWDAGYPDGGNYWSNYNGTDYYHGSNQNISGSDGIGDTPYNLSVGIGKDRYPFIEPNGWNEPRVDWWPMYRHDQQHTGYSTSKAPVTNNVLWTYALNRSPDSSPIVVNEKVYVVSQSGTVCCLDAETGNPLWFYNLSGGCQSTPIVVDGKVYIGSNNKKIHCLNATSGSYIWSYTTGGSIWSDPIVAYGKIFFASADYKIYCLDAFTGEYIWSYTTGYYIDTSPAVVDRRVFIGSWDKKMYCLDALTGDCIWSFSTGSYILSSPVVVNSRVYICSADLKIYCLDYASGNLIWSHMTGGVIFSTPAIVNGKIYLGCFDKNVSCMDAETGDYIWNYTATGILYSSPSIADGKLYIRSGDHKFYCLNATTGILIWNFSTNNENFTTGSSPAIANKKAYICSDDGILYCFQDKNQPPSIPNSPNPSNGTINVNLSINICWSPCVDPEGDPVTYDVFFGTTSNPLKVVGNQTTTSYNPGILSFGTIYYWKIIAWDNHSAHSIGSLWHFMTHVNNPPNIPSNPTPANGATNIPINTDLSWTGGDSDPGDTVTYDIYFGPTNPPPIQSHNQTGTTYDTGTMIYSTMYYWKIKSWDNHGESITGPTWGFTTHVNNPPNIPSSPTPSNGATSIIITTDLSWTGGDPDAGDTVTYDVYFGTTNPPSIRVHNQSGITYDTGTMTYSTTHYWKIKSWDNHGASTTGPTWNFTTQPQPNNPPNTPGSPTPANGATNIPINSDLSWTGGDPDTGDTATYDVYYGTINSPPKVIGNQTSTTYNLPTLAYSTQYYWKIIAWDNDNVSTSGLLWSFTTTSEPSQPSPPPPATPENSKPTAKAGGPYQGFVGEEIQFNGLKSFDSDGKIVSYKWEYGDGTNGTGNITTHSYSRKGTYTIILTVTDDEGAKDTDETNAIILQANNPPTPPSISGQTIGHKRTSYSYTMISTDADNDNIQYFVDWGDTITNTSEFLPNGTIYEMNHSWVQAGIYIISIKAYDNYTESGSAYLIVLIDIQYCNDIGYLIDNNSDGTYDSFYCNETGNKTTVELKDEKYMIDTNGDGNWDYTFDPTEGLAAIQIVEKKGTPSFELILIVCALSLILLCRRYRKNRNK